VGVFSYQILVAAAAGSADQILPVFFCLRSMYAIPTPSKSSASLSPEIFHAESRIMDSCDSSSSFFFSFSIGLPRSGSCTRRKTRIRDSSWTNSLQTTRKIGTSKTACVLYLLIFLLSHISNSPSLRTSRSILCDERGILISEQKRMLEESERMIADTDKRLGSAIHELSGLIVGFSLHPPHQFFILHDRSNQKLIQRYPRLRN
jgi:hypothetical protein